jgi:hypothetical protein
VFTFEDEGSARRWEEVHEEDVAGRGELAHLDEPGRDEPALRVARLRMLDLEDISAPLGKDCSSGGDVGPPRHLQDPHSRHHARSARSRHLRPPRRACARPQGRSRRSRRRCPPAPGGDPEHHLSEQLAGHLLRVRERQPLVPEVVRLVHVRVGRYGKELPGRGGIGRHGSPVLVPPSAGRRRCIGLADYDSLICVQ